MTSWTVKPNFLKSEYKYQLLAKLINPEPIEYESDVFSFPGLGATQRTVLNPSTLDGELTS